MNITRRTLLVCGLLLAAWGIVLVWQGVEHVRVRNSARAALINRAKDISGILGLVLRSQRRFGGVISKERLESALKDLVKQGDLIAIGLLNASGEVVASTGTHLDLEPKDFLRSGEHWTSQSVTLANLVDLGTNVTRELGGTNPTIVLTRHDFPAPFDTNRVAPPPPGPDPDQASSTNAPDGGHSPPPSSGWTGRRGPRDGRPPFGRPPWMSEDDYKSLIQKQGVHSFVIVMSTHSLRALCNQDLWLRSIIGFLATVSVIGSWFAWRNLAKSSDLQIRLIRASELNLRLKEMNLAAAGLAHETRNPLNIIRGLAQLISKQQEAPPEVQKKSREIIDEADRVTAQLNEFINYSRPRELRRSGIPLGPVVHDVLRALNCDIEEKNIRLQVFEEQFTIDADEQLLRQALFNLLLNATQAVEANGQIQVLAERQRGSEVLLEIRDDGPGVPPDRRTEIFKPYFTTNEKGTGLGLAVVQQIVLAHGWEIECLPNQPRGAVFRISHLQLTARA